jgi:hypothetical protein
MIILLDTQHQTPQDGTQGSRSTRRLSRYMPQECIMPEIKANWLDIVMEFEL